MSKKIFIIIFIIWKTNKVLSLQSQEERVLIDISYLRNCETDEDSVQKVSVSFGRLNETDFATNFNWTATEPFDDSYNLHVTMSKWNNGKWDKNFINIKRKDACTSLNNLLGPVWNKIAEKAHILPGCPVKPGFYQVENLCLPRGEPAGPLLSRLGKYYTVFQVEKNDNIAICVETELNIRPAN